MSNESNATDGISVRIEQDGYIEPFSPSARQALRLGRQRSGQSIQPRASYRLVEALERYLNGNIGGHSCLVCGNRGVGKTTLVGTSIEEAAQRARPKGAVARRPLIVQLSAADLIGALGQARPEEPSAAHALPDDSQRLLRHLAFTLSRAVSMEFHECFASMANATRPRHGRSWGHDAAAQFKVDIESVPTVAHLQKYWRRFGALPDGVLFPRQNGRSCPALAEIIVLWKSLQIYRATMSDAAQRPVLEQTHSEAESTAMERPSPDERAKSFERFAAMAVGGSLGGALGLASANGHGGAGVAAGLVAAGVGTLVFAFPQRKRALEHRKVTSFKFDLSLPSLARFLPSLIDELRDVGLCPVFVIDELDKVPEPERRLDSIFGHLKSFLNERAFFVFVADRQYYEQLTQKTIGGRTGVEHTYFGDRMLLALNPHYELDRFMEACISGGVDRGALVLLRKAVLCRARGNMTSLKQQLAQLRSARASSKAQEPGRSLTPSDIIDLYYQVAVDTVLRHALGNPPRDIDVGHYTQLLLDVLYAPHRSRTPGGVFQSAPTIEGLIAAIQDDVGVDVSYLPPTVLEPLLAARQMLDVLLTDAEQLKQRMAPDYPIEARSLATDPVVVDGGSGRVWIKDPARSSSLTPVEKISEWVRCIHEFCGELEVDVILAPFVPEPILLPGLTQYHLSLGREVDAGTDDFQAISNLWNSILSRESEITAHILWTTVVAHEADLATHGTRKFKELTAAATSGLASVSVSGLRPLGFDTTPFTLRPSDGIRWTNAAKILVSEITTAGREKALERMGEALVGLWRDAFHAGDESFAQRSGHLVSLQVSGLPVSDFVFSGKHPSVRVATRLRCEVKGLDPFQRSQAAQLKYYATLLAGFTRASRHPGNFTDLPCNVWTAGQHRLEYRKDERGGRPRIAVLILAEGGLALLDSPPPRGIAVDARRHGDWLQGTTELAGENLTGMPLVIVVELAHGVEEPTCLAYRNSIRTTLVEMWQNPDVRVTLVVVENAPPRPAPLRSGAGHHRLAASASWDDLLRLVEV